LSEAVDILEVLCQYISWPFAYLKKKKGELNKLLVNGYNKSIIGKMSTEKLSYLFIYDNKYHLKKYPLKP